MSFLKSSLFYLKDINDFLDEKFKQYGSKYVENGLKQDINEIIPFLDRVVMNRHYYQLNKERYISETRAKKSYFTMMMSFLIILEIVIVGILGYYMVNGLMAGGKNAFEKSTFLLSYIFPIIGINFLFIIAIQHYSNKINDMKGRLNEKIPVEDVFNDLESINGIAMYYALKKGFLEPQDSSKRKTIKNIYETYILKTQTPKGATLTTFPLLTDIIETSKEYTYYYNR